MSDTRFLDVLFCDAKDIHITWNFDEWQADPRILDRAKAEYNNLRADNDRLRAALTRMVGACASYLENQMPSESDMYNSEYVGPLEQARALLKGE